MSRTFRRKGIEWRFFSCKKHYWLEYDTFVKTGNGHEGYWTYRKMTQQEKDKKYWTLHGESKNNVAWSPNREYYTHPQEVQLRAHNKRELNKYAKNPDACEPMCSSRPPSVWRSWCYY